ncbi:MAG: hypothetical protein ACRD2T_17105 [Thermoanaerobaculia bacterium]
MHRHARMVERREQVHGAALAAPALERRDSAIVETPAVLRIEEEPCVETRKGPLDITREEVEQ